MQRVVTERPVVPRVPLRKTWSIQALAALIVFGALWFVLCRQLSGEWTVNEQYKYGWFVAFFALYLFWLRWQDRPEQRSPRKPLLAWIFIGVPALLLLLPIRLFEIGTPEWRPLGWIHAASVAALTLLYVWSAGGQPWLRHFAFPIAFFFVAVPWVTPIEVPIIQGLMRVVAAVAAETVTLFGIPTQLEGNLIRVTSGLVGVNEACSGVRSLQTSLMIGLLFGELKRLSIWRRFVLVAGAIAIALAANLCRVIFLIWIAATRNISEVNRWHGFAGYTIVGLVFVGSVVLAMLLGRKKEQGRSKVGDRKIENRTSHFPLPTSCVLFALCWIVAVELGAQFWYRVHEKNLVTATRWDVQWPETAPNFRKLKIDEGVRRILRFDEGQGAAWTSPVASASEPSSPEKSKTITCLLYLFRWNAGRNSALLANLHRPDVCLPATGWHQVADTGVRSYPVGGSFALPFRHFEFRNHISGSSVQQIAHAFYCLSKDRVPSNVAADSKLQMAGAPSTWTRGERIRQVLEGRRHLGQQVLEVVFISAEPIPVADAESRFGELVREIVMAKPDTP
jgi:exosortase